MAPVFIGGDQHFISDTRELPFLQAVNNNFVSAAGVLNRMSFFTEGEESYDIMAADNTKDESAFTRVPANYLR